MSSKSAAVPRPSRASTVRGAFAASMEAIDRRSPVAPQVHQILREAIVSVHLVPGQTLSEMDLALELGVSRTPVREAFIRLAMEGLVGVFPQLGTIVAPIDVDAVLEAQFVREVLEVAAARLACASSGPSAVTPLSDVLEAQTRASDASDNDRFHELDDDLHRMVFERAGHPASWRVVHSAKPQLDRVRHLTLPDASTRLRDLTEHREIVDAISSGDAEAADVAVRLHARAILSQLPPLREQFPHPLPPNEHQRMGA